MDNSLIEQNYRAIVETGTAGCADASDPLQSCPFPAMSGTKAQPIVVTNYSMAAARSAVVVLITPFLAGGIAFALFGIEGPIAYGLAAFLAVLLLVMWMSATRLNWSIQLGEHIEVRRTFGVRRYPLNDLTSVRVRWIGSSLAASEPWFNPAYSVLVFQIRDGGRFQVRQPAGEVERTLWECLEKKTGFR